MHEKENGSYHFGFTVLGGGKENCPDYTRSGII